MVPEGHVLSFEPTGQVDVLPEHVARLGTFPFTRVRGTTDLPRLKSRAWSSRYRRSFRRVKGEGEVTPARPEGANRAFGPRSPFSAPLDHQPALASCATLVTNG